MHHCTSYLLLLLFLSCQNTAELQTPLSVDVSDQWVIPKHYVIAKTKQPLNIDGLATEPAWQNAPFSESFIDIEGVKIPKYDTKMKMLWDDEFLYVFAQMEEPHIWGNLKQRDTVIFYNNDFEVFIDPSCDTYYYGEIEINALGTVWDLLLDKPYRVGGKANNHWNLDELKYAIYINGTLSNSNDQDSFWTVEMAIPMKPLIELKDSPKTLPREGEHWHLNFSRVNWDHDLINGAYQRKKEKGKFLPEYNWVWSNQKVINMHEPEKWGHIQFTESNTPHGVSFITEQDVLIKQIAYALFRQTRFGDLKHLNEHPVAYTREIHAKYTEDKYIPAKFYKTNFGFEYRIKVPDTNRHYIINEEGILKNVRK